MTSTATPRPQPSPRSRLAFLAVAAILVFAPPTFAGKLPVRAWTTADGLPLDTVRRIVPDSRGFLWFASPAGLGRFDGQRVRMFGSGDGLPDEAIFSIFESRRGDRWIGTGEGTALLPAGGAAGRFEAVEPGTGAGRAMVRGFAEDRDGAVWAATSIGLCRLERDDRGRWHWKGSGLEFHPAVVDEETVYTVHVDCRGTLWVGTAYGLFRRRPDGTFERLGPDRGVRRTAWVRFAESPTGRLFAATADGLAELVPDAGPGEPVVAGWWGTADGIPWPYLRAVLVTSAGELWVAGSGGAAMAVLGDRPGPLRFEPILARDGLTDINLFDLSEDRDGNVWIGSESGGAIRVARSGWSRFDGADGLDEPRVTAIFESRRGELDVVAGAGSRTIYRFDRATGRFRVTRPSYPLHEGAFGWAWGESGLQDHAGEWWFVTAEGLARFGAADRIDELDGRAPKRFYRVADGLPTREVFRVYEDRHGDLWLSHLGRPEAVLARWVRATDRIETFRRDEGIPEAAPTWFAEDCEGNLWIGFYDGGLLRWRDGRFEPFGKEEGLPEGFVAGIDFDATGRMWVATANGLAACDAPASAHPRFRSWGVADGLGWKQASSVVCDEAGRVWVGTARGLDRFDPATNRFLHFSIDDGLPNNAISVAFKDRSGVLWFGTLQGLARLVPAPDRPRRRPPVFIDGLRIAGEPRRLPVLGATSLDLGDIAGGGSRIEIDAIGLGLAPGEVLRYQYRIEGVDGEWEKPTERRSLALGRLGPGDYRVEVRAVNADGLASESPASLSFRILPPLWRRGWFLALVLGAGSLATLLLVRSRVRDFERRQRELARLVDERTADLAAAKGELEESNRSLERRVHDGIDALREAERAAAYGRMVATVAHEIRHPIFAIRAVAWVLADRLRGDESLASQVRTIDREAGRMTSLMDELLDFARPSALAPVAVDPAGLFADAVESYRAGTDPEKLAVEVTVEPGLGLVRMDRSRILQALVNLMQNAFRHARGATRIALSAAAIPGGIRIEVANDGEPIPAEVAQQIFDPFFTTGKGTGLGLAIVRRIVTDHGGTISVESDAERGTRFRIELTEKGENPA